MPLSGLSSRFARHGYSLALLAIAASTLIFLPGRDYFAKGQWALLYLLVILFVASAAGAGPAVLAAVLAFLGWDFFFLPPYGTFVIADVKDWLALIAFLVIGVIVGVQAGRMRDREARAMARVREAAALSRRSAAASLSRAMALASRSRMRPAWTPTMTPMTRKAISASQSLTSAITNVPYGGRKKKSQPRKARTAARTAGPAPAALATKRMTRR